MFSLNVSDLKFSESMGVEERWEILSQEELNRLKGGASLKKCPPMCTCDIDCPKDGCVDCFCFGKGESCSAECAMMFFCSDDCYDMQCMADT